MGRGPHPLVPPLLRGEGDFGVGKLQIESIKQFH
jgi:hypothetical protein